MRQAQQAEAKGENAIKLAHVAAAESGDGTLLPDDFPGITQLLEARPVPYRYYEDLHGSDRAELEAIDGIGPKTAQSIMDAYAEWDAAQE